MEYYFTWHDIEDIFEENRNTWPKTWVDVQVYSDSVEIYQNGDEPQVSDIQYLKEIFGRNYSTENNTLRIDFTGIYLEVTCMMTVKRSRRNMDHYSETFIFRSVKIQIVILMALK